MIKALFDVWCAMEDNLANKGELRGLVRHAKRRHRIVNDAQFAYDTPRKGELGWLEVRYDGLKYLFLLPEPK